MDDPFMRSTKESLSVWVFVRRVRSGSMPFRWEIHREGCAEPIFVSPERFVSMEAAHRAGQAKIPDFVAAMRPLPRETEPVRATLAEMTEDAAWRDRQF